VYITPAKIGAAVRMYFCFSISIFPNKEPTNVAGGEADKRDFLPPGAREHEENTLVLPLATASAFHME